MLHQRKEHNGYTTHIPQKDKEGKEGATQVCYHVLPHRAHERSDEHPARATNRDQQTCGTNQGAGRGIGKRAPTGARLRYVIRRDAATNVVPTMHDEGPHTPSLPLVSQGARRIPTYTRCHASLCMHPPSLLFTGPKEKCVLVFASFVR